MGTVEWVPMLLHRTLYLLKQLGGMAVPPSYSSWWLCPGQSLPDGSQDGHVTEQNKHPLQRHAGLYPSNDAAHFDDASG